jgi:hypothetical protein
MLKDRIYPLVLLIAVLTTSVWAADQNVTTSTFSSALSSASAGDRLLLAPGNYGTFSGASKTGMVTILPDSSAGANQSNVIFKSINFTSGGNVTLSGVTVGGGNLGNASTDPVHVVLQNIHWTGPLCINHPVNSNVDITLDGGDFTNVGQSCTEGRLGITGNNKSHSVVNGIVIKNIKFSGSGPSDGIQLNGNAYGTVIGPGNEFVGIKQSGCGSVHCDPIQFYGGAKTTITGNYFHGNSTGIMSPDGNGTPVSLTNNVFVTDGEYPDQIMISGGRGDVMTHNTFAGGANIRLGNPNGAGLSSNETITDNIISGRLNLTEGQSTSGFTMGYNLIPGGGGGSNSISGSATYVGGARPSTVDGFELAATSLGVGAANDGKDMGVVLNATAAQAPNPPSNLSAQVQ